MKFLITGGASIVNNIGDQAMLFTLIEHIRLNYPKSDIVLFDEKAYFNKSMRDAFHFRILPDIPMEAKLSYVNKFLHLIYIMISKKRFYNKLSEIIKNEYDTCDYIFQLGGFSLSSQMKFNNILSRVWDIALAAKLKKEIILLPQSIGPLEYPGLKNRFIIHYLKKYINYPKYVLCREYMGKKLLEEYGCRKARIEHDLVLARPGALNPDIIYKSAKAKTQEISIDKSRDVVVVPNSRFLLYRPESEIIDIFREIINGCLEITGGKVVIFVHATEDDLDISRMIYDNFKDNPSVILIEKGYDCIETIKLFEKFALAIPCRWHSNAHAIRAGLPHVVIGWAEKYHETSRIFKNEDNVFDIRKTMVEKDIIEAIERVYNNRIEISGQINRRLDKIKKTFCLDEITKHITED